MDGEKFLEGYSYTQYGQHKFFIPKTPGGRESGWYMPE